MNSKRILTNSELKLKRLYKQRNEIKNTAQDMKEEFNKDMESLRKKHLSRYPGKKSSLSQIKNTVESYSSRLEQTEDRIC
jgi:hypothetical protein